MRSATSAENPVLKLVLELGPLLVFFLVNARIDLFAATAGFMLATVLALVVSYVLYRKVPAMPLVTGVVVLVFGGLTLYLHDAVFIKMKPTIVDLLFAAILFGGLVFSKRSLLSLLLGSVFSLDEAGWRSLTIRWALFFVVLATLNEIVWRNFSTDTWVTFKVFGVMPITILFAMLQVPLLQRHRADADDQPAE